MPIPLWRQARGFLLLVLFVAFLSYLPLPIVLLLDLTVFYNPKEATPLLVVGLPLVTAFLFFLFRYSFPPHFLLAPILVAGGALGNISYRLGIGPVADYLPLPYNLWANAADVFIVSGVVLLIIFSIRFLSQEGDLPFFRRRYLETENDDL